MDQDMVILARTFDLLEWLLPNSERFPRIYRSTVTQRLMDASLDLQEALIAAESRAGRPRVAALRDADAALGRLRIYLRLAHRWRWLSVGQYEHASRMVAEIGRLLGGWFKSERARGRSMNIGGQQSRGAGGAKSGRRPLFCMRPTAWPHPALPCGRDAPAPSFLPRLEPANRGRRTTPGARRVRNAKPTRSPGALGRRASKGPGRCGRTNHTETDVVVPVVRVVPVAVGRARVVLIVVPGPAAQHAKTHQRAAPPAWSAGKTDHSVGSGPVARPATAFSPSLRGRGAAWQSRDVGDGLCRRKDWIASLRSQ